MSRETAADEIALRLRDGRRLDPQPAAEALDRITRLVRAQSTELTGRCPRPGQTRPPHPRGG